MYCSNCGNEVSGKFCSNCGLELAVDAEQDIDMINNTIKEEESSIKKTKFSLETLSVLDSSDVKGMAILAKDKLIKLASEKMEQQKEQRQINKQAKKEQKVLDKNAEKENKIRQKQFKKDRMKELKRNNIAYCPKCKSTSLSSNKQGYGIGKGLIGASLTGSTFGLVAGNIGSDKVKITCLNCGYKFYPGQKIYL